MRDMNSFNKVSVLLSALLIGSAATARADVFYSFDPLNPSGTNYSVSVAPGDTVSVPVYLVFTGSDAWHIQWQNGLFSADVELVRTSIGPSQPAGIANPNDVTGNAAFDDPFGPVITWSSPDDVDLYQHEAIEDLNGVSADLVAADTRQILLGTFTFTAGGAGGQSTTFQAQDYSDPIYVDTITFKNSFALDSLIGDAELTLTTPGIAAVPLPNSALAAAAILAAIGMFGVLRRNGCV
jgi:hypothetical protein